MKLLSQEDFTGKVFPQAPDNASDVYRDLVEHSHDLLCTHDLSGKLLSVNPTPARLLGYEVDELLHTPMRNLIAPEYCAQFDDYLVTIKREGVAKGYLALVTKSGERRIWEYHNTLRTEGLPSPVVRGIAHDVTDQKRAEKELRRATQQNRQIITGVGHGLILVDRNLRCVVWNRYMEELTLLPFEQVWGRDLLELLPQLQECGIRALLEQALTGKSLTIPDVGVRSARGDVRWLASKLSPLFGSTGENNGIIIALHDVTERRKAEDALRQSEARFRVALKSSPITVFNQDRNLRYTWMHSPRFGEAGQTSLGKTTAEMFPAEDAACISAVKRRVLESGHGAREQVELTFDGKKRFIDLTVEPLMGANGQIDGITCASVDVTESRARTNLLEMLLEINRALASKRELSELLATIASCIRPVFHHEITAVSLYEADTKQMRISAVDTLADSKVSVSNMRVPESECISTLAFHSGETELFEHSDLATIDSRVARRSLEAGIRSLVCVPLKNRKGPFGVLSLARRKDHSFATEQLELLEEVAAVVAIALDNARAYNEIAYLRDKLQQEKIYLEGEIRAALHCEEIVGESPALADVLLQAQRVAASDATVLVLGDTGTGKELIARSIHRLSTRRDKAFIKLNCAAIPTGLLESELFGHERGAFTGAVSQKLGRLELADQGTLFLDEVGDIPPELQPKLLRVLQDQEFERLGSNRTRRVDVRLVTATNRDLSRSVAEKEFRSDLYYRLNVFPIRLPALRERVSDIPLLVRHFVQRYALKMNKPISTIPQETMNALMRWSWPGNIRELENFIERSVILTEGSVLQSPISELAFADQGATVDDLEKREREHIANILRESRGNIATAAARLGLKRTTLQSKIHRLGLVALKPDIPGHRFPRVR